MEEDKVSAYNTCQNYKFFSLFLARKSTQMKVFNKKAFGLASSQK